MSYHPPVGLPSPSVLDPSFGSASASASIEATIVEHDGARPPPEPVLGRGDQIGRYLLLDPLGHGAMGQVFRAYDPDLDRQVALKILHERGGPDARDRLLREAKAMARIHHPHVITVYDAGMHEDSVFIAMELVEGPSLERWLAGSRSPAEILDVLTGAARGLAAAHAAGVTHRDFKPANVLVTADGHGKVGDFGLAGIDDPASPTAESGHVMGSPAYMSPEHFAGVGVDARSDQFSFAITLHEALHGARPFSATTWPELVVQVTTGELTSAPTTRRGGIDGILRRALAVDPAQRFPTMNALIEALARARRPVWRRWAGVGAVALVLGLVITASTHDDAKTEACEPGARRAEAVWNKASKAALKLGGGDYTEAFAQAARERFEAGVSDYAARWSAAHDESCAAVGPRAQRGTPAQRHTAECLENRLDSLAGLTELATREPLPANRVTELLRALPAIDGCTSGSWIPYPADPDEAAQAAVLHRRLNKIDLAHIWGQQAFALAEAEAAVEAARALGDRYLLARALVRHAVVLELDPRASPLFDEALELAVAGGFDRLSATTLHEIIQSAWPREQGHSWQELAHLAAIARGLVERTTGDPSLLGNLALSEGNVMRRANRLDEATTCDRRAEALFASIGDHEGVAKARINQAVTELRRGRLDEAVPRLEAAVADLEQATGIDSDVYYQAQHVLVGTLTGASRAHEAYAVAAKAYASGRQRYAPHASSFRRVLIAYVSAAANVGELAAARAALELRSEISTLTSEEARNLDLLELELMLGERRFEDVLARIAKLRRTLEADDPVVRAWLELYTLYTLYLLGQRTELHARLVEPPSEGGGPREHEGLASMVVLVAMLSGAPEPADSTWHSRFPVPPYQMALTDHIRGIVDVLASGRDTVATLRRVRSELTALYHPRETTVQMLDAWLAEHDPGPLPSPDPPR